MPAMRYVVIGLAILAIVWPTDPQTGVASLAGSQWRVVEVAGAPAQGTIRFTQSSVRGKAPCNAFFGAFRESEGGIEIAGLNVTRTLCSGRMELERLLLDAFSRARSWRAEPGTILLLDEAGATVMRLAG